MTEAQTQSDVPLPLAALALGVVGCAYFYLTYFRFEPAKLDQLRMLIENHSTFWWMSLVGLAGNLAFVTTFFSRAIGLERQGSKLEVLQGKAKPWGFSKAGVIAAILAISAYFVVYQSVMTGLAPQVVRIVALPILSWIAFGLSANLAVFSYFSSRLVFLFLGRIRFGSGDTNRLRQPVIESGELVLGTTPGELSHSAETESEKWVKIPARGVNGGVFISGSIGSGKTQGTILRYLRQILNEPKGVPSILLVDPKGTFLKEAEHCCPEKFA